MVRGGYPLANPSRLLLLIELLNQTRRQQENRRRRSFDCVLLLRGISSSRTPQAPLSESRSKKRVNRKYTVTLSWKRVEAGYCLETDWLEDRKTKCDLWVTGVCDQPPNHPTARALTSPHPQLCRAVCRSFVLRSALAFTSTSIHRLVLPPRNSHPSNDRHATPKIMIPKIFS